MTNRIGHPHPPGRLDGWPPMSDPHHAAVSDHRLALMAEAAERRLAAGPIIDSTAPEPCPEPCRPAHRRRVRGQLAHALVAAARALDSTATVRDEPRTQAKPRPHQRAF
jgi:hypothetical protein